MSHSEITDVLFFQHIDQGHISSIVTEALAGADDGELFLEYRQSENISLDDGRIKSAGFDISQGFGLRAVSGEACGYAQASEISEDGLKRAVKAVRTVHLGNSGQMDLLPSRSILPLYTDQNPLRQPSFKKKIDILHLIDAYARKQDSCVRQVMANIAGSWQAICIVRADGSLISDIRPLVRMNISVMMNDKGITETGSYGMGGRVGYDMLLDPENWKNAVDRAIGQARVNLDSVPAPVGEMTVVLGSGWPGILLHEAIGHGLEGDFNRKGTSAFTGRIGEMVATSEVTVIDDGTLPDRRGSMTIDDEGTPTGRTVLIENGILKNYLFDRLNARLMKQSFSGNGRRQSYAHQPLPRMTNTFMLGGDKSAEEIIASTKDGIYAVDFGGGQVDITSGKFVFSTTEAYLIKNGKIGQAVKGATLIGNGPDILTRVKMVGNDMKLDNGIGTCGKNGQSVPVGIGQPTIRIDGLTVGGTAF